MDAVLKIVQTVNMYLSDYILIIMLIGCGLYFSFKTKFVQVRCFGEGWRKVFGNFSLHGGKHEGGMSSFQALATAIAAQVGTGNIVGACGAILVGGPGAIFWMWIIAFFGMSTIYAEAVLAQKTRVVNPDGTVAGGPVYYIKKAFNNAFGKFMAGFFAVAIILALGFMGAMVQSNSIGESCQNAFGIPSWIMGAIIAVICAFIFIGGAHRVAAVAEKLRAHHGDPVCTRRTCCYYLPHSICSRDLRTHLQVRVQPHRSHRRLDRLCHQTGNLPGR